MTTTYLMWCFLDSDTHVKTVSRVLHAAYFALHIFGANTLFCTVHGKSGLGLEGNNKSKTDCLSTS